MDFLKKLFPLSKAMSDTFKRFLIGCGIYAAIFVAFNYVINLIIVPIAFISAFTVVGLFIGIPVILVLGFLIELVRAYCLAGAVILTVLFWKSLAERDSLKKFFPLAYLLNDTKSNFILSIVLYVLAIFALSFLLPIVSMPFALIPMIGGILSALVGSAAWVYYAATLTLHILAYREDRNANNVEETVVDASAAEETVETI